MAESEYISHKTNKIATKPQGVDAEKGLFRAI
ncbi:hypothetical protein FERRO_11470 [Ferrovum sp. JA12]|nr:hypothetical protein FERRO_11470 [Ferrovum sp. JA12]